MESGHVDFWGHIKVCGHDDPWMLILPVRISLNDVGDKSGPLDLFPPTNGRV